MAFEKLRESLTRNERRISAAAIVTAFIIDSVTLVRVDEYLTIAFLFLYLAVIGVGIILINLYEDGRLRSMSGSAYAVLFIAVQFCFAGLFGRFLIYYGRSGSIASSWPFLLLLLGLLVGNEFAKKYYTRLLLQISFYFLCLFSFLIFYIPILVGEMSDTLFVVSGVLSVVIIYAYLRLLGRLVPERINQNKRWLYAAIAGIFLSMNALYFANIIPPIPLALREVGVYHSVARVGDGYHVTREREGRFDFLTGETLHLVGSEPVYVYSAIFAPTRFDAAIVHHWQRYDETKRIWTDQGSIVFNIVGGADRGYRGYTFNSNLATGRWRVRIETVRGAVIGQIGFYVVRVEERVQLIGEDI